MTPPCFWLLLLHDLAVPWGYIYNHRLYVNRIGWGWIKRAIRHWAVSLTAVSVILINSEQVQANQITGQTFNQSQIRRSCAVNINTANSSNRLPITGIQQIDNLQPQWCHWRWFQQEEPKHLVFFKMDHGGWSFNCDNENVLFKVFSSNELNTVKLWYNVKLIVLFLSQMH